MKPEQMIKAVARLDKVSRIEEVASVEYFKGADWFVGTLPDGYKIILDNYLDELTGHGHIQRVIDGLDKDQNASGGYYDYGWELNKICKRDTTLGFCATCAQKIEALLRMAGTREEGE